MVVSDAIVLSVIADGVILVAEGGKTPKQDARAAIFRLRQANARIFGFVLNKVRIHKSDYPYYYHSESYGQYCNDGIEDEVEETTQASHLDA
jgi:Mrp family chromosome partitioning ATPase